ncbi:MAG: efflux RND transporter periplasmic adaptor subunit [Clostridiaceae bacterium]|nr:efflux RND transporter periplasmic adaptor subunit [Clostridiaceae bacterium]
MKKKIVIGFIGILVISVVVILNIVNTGADEAGIPVRAVDAKKQDIYSYVSTSGLVQEEDSVLVYVEADARINKVYVKQGDVVKKGQVLASVEIEDMQNALEQARISLDLERLALENIKTQNRLQDTSEAELNVNRAEMALEKAREAYSRDKVLYEQGAISLVDLERSQAELDNAELELQRARNSLENIKKKNEEAQVNLENELAVQQNKIKLAQLKVKELEEKLSKQKEEIISPIDGAVTAVNIVEGQKVMEGTHAFTVADIYNLIIKANVSEYDIGKVKVGQEVEITGDGLQKDKIYKGRIKKIASTATKVRQGNVDETVVEVIIEVVDKDESIKPGFSIDAKIITDKSNDAIVVPYEVLKDDEDRKLVYVFEDGKAKEVQVETGIESDLFIEIKGNIKEGDKIISNPSDKIKDGTSIRLIEDKKDK